jgi:hypothetical protein
LEKIEQTDKYKLHRTEKKKGNLGIPLSIGVIGSEGESRGGRQRERRLIARKLFWWLTESMNCGWWLKGEEKRSLGL